MNQIRWMIPNKVENASFVGKDVISVHSDAHIMFYNLNLCTQSIYTANDNKCGDGIECFIGHKTQYVFAFAEKSNCPKIFLLAYPNFKIISIVTDESKNNYAALEFTELEHIVAISNSPTCSISVWCWRNEQKLISYETQIESPLHTIKSNVLQSSFCYSHDDIFCVWEIVQTHKACMLLSKPFQNHDFKVVDFVWSNEGCLYVIDERANLLSMNYEGLYTTSTKEWTFADVTADIMITFFKNCLIVYGPNASIQCLKKVGKEWSVKWTHTPDERVIKLISSYVQDLLLYITRRGDIVKLVYENGCVNSSVILFMECGIEVFDVINPQREKIVTLSSGHTLCLWDGNAGMMKLKMKMADEIFNFRSNPLNDSIAICYGSVGKYGVGIMKVSRKLEFVSSKCLSDRVINGIEWTASGRELLACSRDFKSVFYLKVSELSIDVIHFIDLEVRFKNCILSTLDDQQFLICHIENEESKNILIFYNISKTETPASLDVEKYENIFSVDEKKILLGFLKTSTEFDLLEIERGEELTLKKIKSIHFKDNIENAYYFIRPNIFSWDNTSVKVLSINNCDISENLILKVMLCHKFGNVIKKMYVDCNTKSVIALSSERNLLIFVSKNKTKHSEKVILDYELQQAVAVEESSRLYDDTDYYVKEMRMLKESNESIEFEATKKGIVDDYRNLQEQLSALLDENNSFESTSQLPLKLFRLGFVNCQKIFDDAKTERELEQLSIKNRVFEQNRVSEWIKSKCWDGMDVIGTQLHSIFTNEHIDNYPLPLSDSNQKSDKLQMLKLLEQAGKSGSFSNWTEVKLSSDITKEIGSNGNDNVSTIFFSQLFLQSFLQTCLYNTKEAVLKLMMEFNELFNSLMKTKDEEIILAKKRSDRLCFIISELNELRRLKGDNRKIELKLKDPDFVQEERPIKLTLVEDNEICVSPYESPTRKVKPVNQVIEDDPFCEEALMNLMDGTLEKKWHEEIKRSIPKPLCMTEKDNDELSNNDLTEIAEWYKKTQEQEKERIKYGNLLYSEFFTVSKAFRDSILIFNQNYKNTFVNKLKIDFMLAYEELKHMFLRINNLEAINGSTKQKGLEAELMELESEMERVTLEINEIHSQLSECHVAHENLLVRDKTLDKNFKSNFPDVTPIVIDLCYKSFKKRPKWQCKSPVTVSMLIEMAQMCLTKDKAKFPHSDFEYLNGMDQLDLAINMPPVLDEQTWINVCRLRRSKVENEIKIRVALAEISDVEAALSNWQKRLNSLRLLQQKLKTDLATHRTSMEMKSKNKIIPLLVKNGLVEIEMTGHLDNFQDVILIQRKEIQLINDRVKVVRQMKDKAESATVGFKKHIIAKEWEHATLKMKVDQLNKELYYFRRIKVTREIKDYIQDRTKVKYKKNDIEKQLKATKRCFEKQLFDQMHYVEELEMKIFSLQKHCKNIDCVINKFKENILKCYKDPKGEKEKKLDAEKRMNTLVWRNRLVSEVQKQQLTIILLQTELELQHLKTFPILSTPQLRN